MQNTIRASSTIGVSTKAATTICRVLNRQNFVKAKKFLEDVAREKKSIEGKYYTKTAKEILKILNSAESNAKSKNVDLNNMELILAANRGPTLLRGRRKRDFGYRLKMTHIQVYLKPKGEK